MEIGFSENDFTQKCDKTMNFVSLKIGIPDEFSQTFNVFVDCYICLFGM